MGLGFVVAMNAAISKDYRERKFLFPIAQSHPTNRGNFVHM